MRNSLIMTKPKELEYYKSIKIHADIGLHDQAIALFQQYVPTGSRVLDIGAGAGAFSKHLADSGFIVTALDVVTDKWTHKEIPFFKVDINLGIVCHIDDKFDAACCLEVIEHVENPWSLLREIFQVLKPGGRLILSTPNITSFLSRLIFLRTGEFHQFRGADLSYGHTRPITHSELSIIAYQVGWRIVEVLPGVTCRFLI